MSAILMLTILVGFSLLNSRAVSGLELFIVDRRYLIADSKHRPLSRSRSRRQSYEQVC